MTPAELRDLPPGIAETLALVAGFDACLDEGLGRIGAASREALAAFCAACAGSPFEGPLAVARDQLEEYGLAPRSALVLAAARASLLGAVQDALAARLAAALGSPPPVAPSGQARLRPADALTTALMQSVSQWLCEIALTGWRNLGETEVAPFALVLDRLAEVPELVRAEVLLAGFWSELMAGCAPGRAAPCTRWADLWTRGLLLMHRLPPADDAPGRPVAGRLVPLGAEVRGHATYAAFKVHGLLALEDASRWVTLTWQRFKVDLIEGGEVLGLFRPEVLPFGAALAETRALDVTGRLRDDGRLAVATARLADPADPLGSLAAHLAEPPPPPLPAAFDRHPVHLAYPLALAAPAMSRDDAGMRVCLDGVDFPLSFSFQPAWSEINPRALATATGLIGLWRFEGRGWCVQPLAFLGQRLAPAAPKKAADNKKEAASKPRWTTTGSTALAAVAADTDALAILRERASRMLRG